jgi:hypothetical protein
MIKVRDVYRRHFADLTMGLLGQDALRDLLGLEERAQHAL